jgi:hypothetical protein
MQSGEFAFYGRKTSVKPFVCAFFRGYITAGNWPHSRRRSPKWRGPKMLIKVKSKLVSD